MNAEDDEAGRLKQFRLRFGRGWDAESNEQVSRPSTRGEMSPLLIWL